MDLEYIYPKSVYNPNQGLKGSVEGDRSLPYSQAVKANGLLFLAGQGPVDIDGNVVHIDDITKQIEKTLENLKSLLEEAGCSLDHVVQTMWFTTSIKDFYDKGGSDLRRKYFNKHFPPSTLVEVRRLSVPEWLVEVQAIAVLPSN